MPDTPLAASQRRLNAAKARRRRLAAGPPLSVTDADLDALSTVDSSAVPELEAYVRDLAGQRAVDMVKAEREG